MNVNVLKSKPCPHCSESNKPDAKFCMSCKMVLTYDAYTGTTAEEVERARELQRKQDKLESMQKELVQMFDAAIDYFKLNEPKTWRDRVQKTAPPRPDIDAIDEIKQYCKQEIPKIKPESRHGVSYLESLQATYKQTIQNEENLKASRREHDKEK